MRIWEQYPSLTKAIYHTHKSEGGQFLGHDFDHVIRVANCAQQIAPDNETGRLAGVAALCHNADRIWQKRLKINGDDEVEDKLVTNLINEWLNYEPTAFSLTEKSLIIDAVLHHNQKNNTTNSDILITLMDADRIINTELDAIIRHARYRSNLQLLDPIYLLNIPGEDFKNPKSILSSLLINQREWLNLPSVMVRLPKSKELMAQRLIVVEQFIAKIIAQREEAGLIPFPIFN